LFNSVLRMHFSKSASWPRLARRNLTLWS